MSDFKSVQMQVKSKRYIFLILGNLRSAKIFHRDPVL